MPRTYSTLAMIALWTPSVALAHGDEVRSVIARLRDEHGYSKIYVMGHSMGTISSRWLAKNLGSEISGSIHSSSMNRSARDGFANSVSGFSYDTIAAPVLHVH